MVIHPGIASMLPEGKDNRRNGMTEYELADLISSTNANGLVIITVMVSLASAYLIVAWLVGSKLQKSQVGLINTLFLAFIVMFGLSWTNRVLVALAYQEELLKINPSRIKVMGDWLLPMAVVFFVAVTLACLKFMWDIRHPKSQGV